MSGAASRRIRTVLRELARREPIFHRPEFGTTRADFERLTDPGYWEIGASGRRYGRKRVLADITRRYQQPGYRGMDSPPENAWKTKNFACRPIGPDSFLLTYILVQGKRVTRRATIWRRSRRGWRILYHQGTLVSDASG